MSVTRILCDKCGLPLVHCDCRTLKVGPSQEVETRRPAEIDFKITAPSYDFNTTATNGAAPPKKKHGRSKFF